MPDRVDEPVEVVLDPLLAVVGGGDPGVVAVIAGDGVVKRLDRPAAKEHAAAQVRVDVPTKQHLLVTPVDGKEVLTKRELEIAGLVETDPLAGQRWLIEVQGGTETLDLLQRS